VDRNAGNEDKDEKKGWHEDQEIIKTGGMHFGVRIIATHALAKKRPKKNEDIFINCCVRSAQKAPEIDKFTYALFLERKHLLGSPILHICSKDTLSETVPHKHLENQQIVAKKRELTLHCLN